MQVDFCKQDDKKEKKNKIQNSPPPPSLISAKSTQEKEKEHNFKNKSNLTLLSRNLSANTLYTQTKTEIMSK